MAWCYYSKVWSGADATLGRKTKKEWWLTPFSLPKGPSFPARVWTWLGSWFTDKQKEVAVNVIDVAADANGIAPPGTVSDAVDIVKDAAPSLKETIDNADEYFDTYEDAPDRDRFTLETENPEKNAPAPWLYRWFWGLFQ